MPIVTQCPSCGKRLKAPDDRIGKQAKCPQCKTGFTVAPATDGAPTPASTPALKAPTVPAPAPAAATAPAVSQAMWHVQTADGTNYGPVTKADLDAWVADERLDADCQLLMDGWDQWKWAEEVYPQLAPAQQPSAFDVTATAPGGVPTVTDSRNPYASPTAGGATPAGEGMVDSMRAARALKQTRPWVMMFSIFNFIGLAFAVIGLIFSVLTMFVSPIGGLLNMLIVGTYGAIYGYLGMVLMKYAGGCERFFRSKTVADLESALEAQRDFWKFAGIMTLVAIGITLLVVMLMIFALGSIAAFSSRQP